MYRLLIAAFGGFFAFYGAVIARADSANEKVRLLISCEQDNSTLSLYEVKYEEYEEVVGRVVEKTLYETRVNSSSLNRPVSYRFVSESALVENARVFSFTATFPNGKGHVIFVSSLEDGKSIIDIDLVEPSTGRTFKTNKTLTESVCTYKNEMVQK